MTGASSIAGVAKELIALLLAFMQWLVLQPAWVSSVCIIFKEVATQVT